MIMESTDGGLQGHWNAATNWVVTSGSLANSVAVDSSDTPTDLPDNIVSTKSPLILRPPSSDSVPCEITINFSKRHEVRQVYVKSTARVYEIYVTPKVQDDYEYLCTVRCGIAAKEEISNVALCNEDGSPRLGESKHSNDEEWVQVKVPNASGATNGVSTASVNPCMDMDLYEATAEISDADPCISLTLKLVSVQSKGCVYVDEVYIFADPVDIDSDIQEDKAGNFAGSSALAMLIPSILQISRAKAGIVEQDEHNFGFRDNQRSSTSEAGNMEHERLPEEVHETPTAKRNDEEMKHPVTNDKQASSSTVAEQPRQNSQYPDNGRSRVDAPCGRVETLLEQLVSRVSRMEDLYLRFEESMLRPINSIEARLQQVELKIESLVERQLNDGERGCKRFSAPEYSLSESNVNSIYVNEAENYKFGEPDQYLHEDEASDKSSQLQDGDGDGDGDDILETTPHLIPCLTVTAPEFSQCDEDDNSSLVAAEASSVSDSAKEKPRQVSIDDALATALAGFMSSVPVRRTQSLVVKAPDFSNEEEDDNFEEKVSPEIKLNVPANSSMMSTDGVEFSKDPTVSSIGNKVDTANASDSIIITVEKSNEEQHNEREFLQETEGIREVAADDEAVIECSNSPPPPPPLTVQSTGNGEVSLSLAPDETEASNAIHVPSRPVIAKEDSKANVIQDLLLAYSGGCASVVDFKTPILDVTFSPQDTATTTTLECLLGDDSDPPTTAPPNERNYEICSAGEQQHQLIVLDDEMDQISKSGFSLDTAYCDLPEMAVNQQDTEKPDEEKLSAGSLI